MDCKECGLHKKTIKSLKMHIKLVHLRTGKFLCKRCNFSANFKNSIVTHYKVTQYLNKGFSNTYFFVLCKTY